MSNAATSNRRFGAAHPEPQLATEADVVGRRIGALLVDALVVFAVFYAAVRVVGGDPAVGSPVVVTGFLLWFVFNVLGFMPLLVLYGSSPVWYVAAVGIWAVYGGITEALFGQTLGKRAFGLVVVDERGAPVSVRAAAVRNLMRVVDALFFYGLALFVLALSSRRQRFGDLTAGTVVVRRES